MRFKTYGIQTMRRSDLVMKSRQDTKAYVRKYIKQGVQRLIAKQLSDFSK